MSALRKLTSGRSHATRGLAAAARRIASTEQALQEQLAVEQQRVAELERQAEEDRHTFGAIAAHIDRRAGDLAATGCPSSALDALREAARMCRRGEQRDLIPPPPSPELDRVRAKTPKEVATP